MNEKKVKQISVSFQRNCIIPFIFITGKRYSTFFCGILTTIEEWQSASARDMPNVLALDTKCMNQRKRIDAADIHTALNN